jgi:hypothetical protein
MSNMIEKIQLAIGDDKSLFVGALRSGRNSLD